MRASELSHLQPHERQAVSEYLKRIEQRFPGQIISLTLFGSKARGDDDDESDIDLLALVDGDEDSLRTELWRIASNIGLEYDLVISVRVFFGAVGRNISACACHFTGPSNKKGLCWPPERMTVAQLDARCAWIISPW